MRSAVNQTLRKKLAHALDLPAFVLLDQAIVHILGDSDVKIVNHKGLVQYTTDCIKARSTQGLIEVVGENMEIVSFSSGEIKIAGKILQVMLK